MGKQIFSHQCHIMKIRDMFRVMQEMSFLCHTVKPALVTTSIKGAFAVGTTDKICGRSLSS
jgi:hypothetical protein